VGENAAAKADRLLTSGRVVIVRAAGREVDAVVKGDSGAIYAVHHARGKWSCSCVHAPYGWCSHLRAVQTITAPAGPVILGPDLMIGATS